MAGLLCDPSLTFTRPAVHRQPEAGGAAAVEGAFSICALAMETTRGARTAFIHICKSGLGAQKGFTGEKRWWE